MKILFVMTFFTSVGFGLGLAMADKVRAWVVKHFVNPN